MRRIFTLLSFSLLISWLANAQPTQQANTITVQPNPGATTPSTSLKISWTNGNGAGRVVFVSPDASTFQPNADYTATQDANLTTSPDLDGGAGSPKMFCVYSGSASSVNITNMVVGTFYTIWVYEYSAGPVYNKNPGTTNNPAVVWFASNTSTTTAFTGSGYVTPAGVTAVNVQAWGGGGGGGGTNGSTGNSGGGGGGSAGNYTSATSVAVSGTVTFSVGIAGPGGAAGSNNGTDGGPTTFNGGAISASAGLHGNSGAGATNGNGGNQVAGNTFQGGAGAAGTSGGGGGGGGSPGIGPSGGGTGATTTSGGAGGTGGGATGASGPTSTNDGNPGGFPGAGGSGGYATSNTNKAGGNGGGGLLVVSYQKTVGPTFVSAKATSLTNIQVKFSTAVTLANASGVDFSISGGVTVTAAAVNADPTIIDLTVNTLSGTNYSCTGCLSVAYGAVSNANSECNLAIASKDIADGIAPTVVVSTSASSPTFSSPINFTATFSEAVSTFTTGSVTTGGTQSGFSVTNLVNTVTNKTWTFDVGATGQTGTVAPTIAAAAVTDAAGNANVLSTGNPSITLTNQPTQATTIGFSSVLATTMTVTPSGGNGSGYILVARTTNNSFTFSPSDGTDYSSNVNSNFTSGVAVNGGGDKILGIGAGPFSISGLLANTTYYFQVFAFNGTTTTSNYNPTSGPISSQLTACNPPATSNLASAATPATGAVTLTWTTGTSTDGSLVLIRQSATPPTDMPVDGTSYSSKVSTVGGHVQFSSALLNADGHVVMASSSSSTSNSLTVYGLTASTQYSWAIYTFNTTSLCYQATETNGTGTFTTTATGAAELTVTGPTTTPPSSISSLGTALSGASAPQTNAIPNFDFTIADAGADGADGLFSTIVIKQGANNDATYLTTDWSTAISAAQLSDGTNTVTGTVNATDITFGSLTTTSGAIGNVPDGGSKTYTLTIALKQNMGATLRANIDNKQFDFKVISSSFSTTGTTSTINGSPTVSAGANKNVVVVSANKIVVSNTPSTTATVGATLGTEPIFAAVDDNVNANVDLNFGNSITSVNASVANTGAPTTFSSGLANFSGFKFTAVGTSTVGVTANSITSATTASITISSTTTIGSATVGVLATGNVNNSLSNQPVFGFSIATDGAATNLTNLSITSSIDPSLVMNGFTLYKSSTNTNDFATAVTTGLTGTPNPGGSVDFTSISLGLSSTTQYFYLVANTNAYFFSTNPQIFFSLATSGITVALTGTTKAGSSTGNTYTMKDNTAPTLLSSNISFLKDPIYLGLTTQTVTLVYSESMNTATNPSISLSGAGWGSASPSGGTNGWFKTNVNNDSYKATLTHDLTTHETFSAAKATIGTSGATDWGGNSIPAAVLSTSSFVLDTDEPTATVTATTGYSTPSTVNIGFPDLTIQATFSEKMNTGVAPTISFSPSNSHFTTTGGSWDVTNKVYTIVYTHDGTAEEIPSTTVNVDGGTDIPGNVQSVTGTSSAILIDTKAPTVPLGGITRSVTNQYTKGPTVTFNVAFSEVVSNVLASGADFTPVQVNTYIGTPTMNGASTTDNQNFTVSVTGLSGDGDLRLDLNTSGTITDSNGNALASGHTGDEIYTIDNTAPYVTSIVVDPSLVNTGYASSVNGVTPSLHANAANYLVTFNEAVTGVDPSALDFNSLKQPNTSSTVSISTVNVTAVGSAPTATWKINATYNSGVGTFEYDFNPESHLQTKSLGTGTISAVNTGDQILNGTLTNFTGQLTPYGCTSNCFADILYDNAQSPFGLVYYFNSATQLNMLTKAAQPHPAGAFYFAHSTFIYIGSLINSSLASNVVTGVGTSFLSQFNPGDLIVDLSAFPWTIVGQVNSVNSDVSLTLNGLAASAMVNSTNWYLIHPQSTASAIADQAGNTITQSYFQGTYGNFCNPEPSNPVTTFSPVPANNSIKVNWTDVTISPKPDHYLVMLRNKNIVTNSSGTTPVGNFPAAGVALTGVKDGIFHADDNSMTGDGLMVLNVAQGVQTATFSGINSGADYEAIIYPYSLDNNNIVAGDYHAIDYNITTPASITTATTSVSTSTTVTKVSSTSTIASTVNSVGGQAVFSFNIKDDGGVSGSLDDNSPFRFNKIVIVPGSTNNVANWSTTIVNNGAILTNNGNGASLVGTVTANSITFTMPNHTSGTDEGFIDDNQNKTYTLSIGLVNSLTDNSLLDFKVDNTSFTGNYDNSTGNQSSSQISGSSASSGTVKITVSATAFTFATQQPVLTPGAGKQYVLINFTTPPKASAVDVHGNVDVDYTGATFAATVSTPVGGPTFNTASVTPLLGVYTFPSGFQYNDAGSSSNDGTLTLTRGTVNSTAVGNACNPITVVYYGNTTLANGTSLYLGTGGTDVISSVASSPVPVFAFKVTDDNGSGGDGEATKITGFTFTPTVTYNQFSNFQDLIASATLSDGNSANDITITQTPSSNGQINSTDLAFTISQFGAGQLGNVPDDQPKVYTLSIIPKTTLTGGLPPIADGKTLVLDILHNSLATAPNITVDVNGSTIPNTQSATSDGNGHANGTFQVYATEFDFTTEPPAQGVGSYLVSTVLSGQPPVPVVEARDIRGNLDIDYAGAVTISCAAPLPVAGSKSISNAPIAFAAGVIDATAFGAMSIDQIATGAQLTVHTIVPNAGGVVKPSDGVSTAFDVKVGQSSTLGSPVVVGAVPTTAYSSVSGTPAASTGPASVFQFTITDDGAVTPNDGNPTLISQIVIRQNTTYNTQGTNSLADWTQSIAGAVLTDGTASQTVDFSVTPSALTATSITFSNIDFSTNTSLGYVKDSPNPPSSTNSKTYTLKIWLKTTLGGNLPIVVDGQTFGFDVQSVSPTDIVVNANGTDMKSGSAISTSGNTVNVVASKLNYLTLAPSSTPTVSFSQISPTVISNTNTAAFSAVPSAAFPSSAYIYTPFNDGATPTPNPTIGLEAVDVNGNRDLGFTGTISSPITVANSLQLANDPIATGNKTFVNGTFSFDKNFQYTSANDQTAASLNGALTISTTTPTLSSQASPTINVSASIDSYVYFDPSFTAQNFTNLVNQQANSQSSAGVLPDPAGPTIAKVAQFIISDGGAGNFASTSSHAPGDLDGGDTKVTDLTFTITSTSGGVGDIYKLALYDNFGNKVSTDQAITLGSVNSTGGINSGTVTFSGLTISATDNLAATYSIQAIFNPTVYKDGDDLTFQITSVTWGIQGSQVYPQTPTPGYIGGVFGGSISPKNTVDVVASTLDFTVQPSSYAGVNEPIGTDVSSNPVISFNGGSGYTDGTYYGVQLVKSSGTAVTAPIVDIIVAGGVVQNSLQPVALMHDNGTSTFTCPASLIGGTGSGWSITVKSVPYSYGSSGNLTSMPGTYAGVVTSRDALGNIDTNFSPATISLADANGNTITQPAGLSFKHGVMDLNGMKYGTASGANGAITVSTTGPVLTSPSSGGFSCSTVNVMDVNAIFNGSGLVAPGSNGIGGLKGGKTGQAVFGLDFNPTSNSSVGTEPTLKKITIGFKAGPNSPSSAINNNWYRNGTSTTVLSGWAVTLNGTDVTSSTYNAVISEQSSTSSNFYDLVVIDFSQLGGVPPTVNSTLNFIVKANISPTVNSATQNIVPYFIDGGYGTTTDQNTVVSNGTAVSMVGGIRGAEIDGTEYSFASVQPPVLLAGKTNLTSPYAGQSNADPALSQITLQFNTGVNVLDPLAQVGQATGALYDKATDLKVGDLVFDLTYAPTQQQGVIDPLTQTLTPVSPTVRFNVGPNNPTMINPPAWLQYDHVYYVLLNQGSYDPAAGGVKTGVADYNLNFFGGVSNNSVLYFKTWKNVPPNLNSASSSFNMTNLGTITTNFDQLGTAYYVVVPHVNSYGTITTTFIKSPPAGVSASGSYSISAANVDQTITFPANFSLSTAYDVYVCADNDASPAYSSPGIYTFVSSGVVYDKAGAGPTISIPATGAGSVADPSAVVATQPTPNNPGGSSLVMSVCPDSYVTISQPFIVDEPLAKGISFFSNTTGDQNFNILLPTGFQYDVTVAPTVQVIGSDFQFISGSTSKKSSYKYVSNTVLSITFNNNNTNPRAGTISVTAGTTAVTGTGTNFLTDVAVGGILKDGIGTTIGTVASIVSATSLTLTAVAPSTWTNSTYYSASWDVISVSGLSVIGQSNSTQGPIQWFYGNNSFTATAAPYFNLASIKTTTTKIPDFTNSYWYNNEKQDPITLAPISPFAAPNPSPELTAFRKTVNAIPDNYVDPGLINNPGKVRLLPMTPPYNIYVPDTFLGGDFLSSSYAGSGVSGDLLTLNAVTKGAPFNITINHTDINGCSTSNTEQYLVYDHNSAISKKLGVAGHSSIDPVTGKQAASGTVQDISNPNFPAALVGQILPSVPLGQSETAGYTLLELTSDLPASEIVNNASSKYTQLISGSSWRSVVQSLVTPSTIPFTWDYSQILKAAPTTVNSIASVYSVPSAALFPTGNYDDVYNYFKSNKTTSGNNFWTGGSLGNIEFSGAYQSTADQSVYVPFRQDVELFVPAVPLIEVQPPTAVFYDAADATYATAPTFNPTQYPNGYQGTATFCEQGGKITLNAYPVANSSSSGVFAIYDYASYNFTTNTGTPLLASAPSSAFIDNNNGTMVLDPTNPLVRNSYNDVLVTYTYKDNNSPAQGIGYLVIRVTPNPVAAFLVSNTVANPGSSASDKFCAGSLVTFDGSASSIAAPSLSVTPTNTISVYSWDFGDQNSLASYNSIANPSSTLASSTLPQGSIQPGTPGDPNYTGSLPAPTYITPSHIYGISQAYTVKLTLVSKWGCASVSDLSATAALPTTVSSGLKYISAATPPGDVYASLKVGQIPNPLFTITNNCVGDLIGYDASVSSIPTGGVAGQSIAQYSWLYDSLGRTSNHSAMRPYPATFSTSQSSTTVTYKKSGFYNVELTTTTDLGCQNSKHNLVSQLDVVTQLNEYFDQDNGKWQAINLVNSLPDSLSRPNGTGFYPSTWNWGSRGNSTNKVLDNAGNNFWSTYTDSSAVNYRSKERSALYTPCLRLDAATVPRPMISFSSFVDVATGDGVVLQYSIDNKNILDPTKTWANLGTTNTAVNPYPGLDWFSNDGLPSNPGSNNSTGTGWSGNGKKWIHPKHELDQVQQAITAINQTHVVLRFALASVASTSGAVQNLDGFALDSVYFGSRTRTILFENFTTADVGSDAALKSDVTSDNTAISNFVKQNITSTQLVDINYHIGFVGQDPFNLDNPADPGARALYYGVKQVPYAFLDGIHYKGNVAPPKNADLFQYWGQAEYDLNTLQLAKADFKDPNFTPTTVVVNSDGSLDIDVNFTPLFDLPIGVGGTTLQVAILEKVVTNLPAYGAINTGESSFEYVFKAMLPSAVGTQFTVPLQGPTPGPTPTSAPIRHPVSVGKFNYKPKNLHSSVLTVVVFLQNESTKEVYQAELFDDRAINNTVTGIEPMSAENIKLYPNPADQELTIELPSPVKDATTLRLANQWGQYTDFNSFAEGEQKKTIRTHSLAEGVYILQLGSGDSAVRAKVVVLHK